MSILFKNGSRWRVVGTDNPNSLVGTAPAGIVFSEWALSNPSSWAYLAPILEENGGWAMFITTPRGRNHAHSMYEMARKSKNWLAMTSNVINSGYPLDRVETQRAEYHEIFGEDAGDALIEQEFYCNWDAAILGAYWGRELTRALAEGRITEVWAEPGAPIHRAWDLGVGDSMAIWFFQMFAGEIRVLDFYQNHGLGIDHYAKIIRKDYNIRGGIDFVPHDARFREMGNEGKMRLTSMIEDGLNPEVVTNHKVEDGINAARRILPRCWFDEERCGKGLEMLRHYRAEWDDKRRTFNDQPEHDFSSHASDAFRYLAMAYEKEANIKPLPRTKILQITGPGINPLKGIMPVTGHEVDGISLNELFELNERDRNRVDGYR
jgi:phage terminase large subunit